MNRLSSAILTRVTWNLSQVRNITIYSTRQPFRKKGYFLTSTNSTCQVALSNILKEDGMRGLFTGAGPRSVWWFCVCSVFFASFERIRTYIHREVSQDVEAIKTTYTHMHDEKMQV